MPCAHGRLEANLKEPRGVTPDTLRGAALVLHPHPLHGGTMHNKVVFRLARGIENAQCVTLRINFRGVGASTGTHDNARGEGDDARAGLDYLSQHYANLSLLLAGFSFGARVGLETGIRDERVRFLIGIGTPINMYDFSFLRACRKPVLFVHGSQDEYGDAEKLKILAAELPPEAKSHVHIVKGAGHFFDDQLDELTSVITEWTNRRLSDDRQA